MNAVISIFTVLVFLFAGLAQSGSLSPKVGYGIAIPLAVITMVLAIMRYRQQKARGE